MIRSQQYQSLLFATYTIQGFIDGEGERPGDYNGEVSLILLLESSPHERLQRFVEDLNRPFANRLLGSEIETNPGQRIAETLAEFNRQSKTMLRPWQLPPPWNKCTLREELRYAGRSEYEASFSFTRTLSDPPTAFSLVARWDIRTRQQSTGGIFLLQKLADPRGVTSLNDHMLPKDERSECETLEAAAQRLTCAMTEKTEAMTELSAKLTRMGQELSEIWSKLRLASSRGSSGTSLSSSAA